MMSHMNVATKILVLARNFLRPCLVSLLVNAVDCIAFSLSLYLFVAFCDHRRYRGLSCPHGPPSRPIIGNLLDVPEEAS